MAFAFGVDEPDGDAAVEVDCGGLEGAGEGLRGADTGQDEIGGAGVEGTGGEGFAEGWVVDGANGSDYRFRGDACFFASVGGGVVRS